MNKGLGILTDARATADRRPTGDWEKTIRDGGRVSIDGPLMNEVDKVVAARGMRGRDECVEWLVKMGLWQWLHGTRK